MSEEQSESRAYNTWISHHWARPSGTMTGGKPTAPKPPLFLFIRLFSAAFGGRKKRGRGAFASCQSFSHRHRAGGGSDCRSAGTTAIPVEQLPKSEYRNPEQIQSAN